MKKIIPILFLLIVIYGYINKENIVIPKNAIRFRIIANSNSLEDQNTKKKIKESLTPKIDELMKEATSKENAIEILNNNIPMFKEMLNEYVKESSISIGNNYFPKKEYNGIPIKEGNYESMVITLGEGLGDNWWCIMYPPLCLIDDNNNQNEYHFLIKDILNKYKS